MTYVKLIADGKKQHLAMTDGLADGETLCGATLTRVHGWKRVTHLEGDECERCAERAFMLTHPVRQSTPTHSNVCV